MLFLPKLIHYHHLSYVFSSKMLQVLSRSSPRHQKVQLSSNAKHFADAPKKLHSHGLDLCIPLVLDFLKRAALNVCS